MSIISTQMSSSIKNGSWIRRMFEAGIQLKQKYGDDAVCDFSLGNPDLAPPPAVGKALAEFVKHVDEPFSLGYMPNNGFGWAREKLAAHLSKEQGVELTANDVILTCGAADRSGTRRRSAHRDPLFCGIRLLCGQPRRYAQEGPDLAGYLRA